MDFKPIEDSFQAAHYRIYPWPERQGIVVVEHSPPGGRHSVTRIYIPERMLEKYAELWVAEKLRAALPAALPILIEELRKQ